jgi:plastocyanin
MRKLAAALAVASLTLAAGCGSDDPETEASATTSAAAESSSAAAPTSSAAAPTSAAAPSSDAGSGTPTVLTGTVGSDSDPEAFVISLTDASGEPVTSLPAGDYTIEVSDPSTRHNFHLIGGEVDETTSVQEKEDTTFEVTLTPGDYTYKCDPHPPMTGSFTVT